MYVTLVIPVYRSKESIFLLVQKVISILTARQLVFEIVLIDDGSTDGTWNMIKALQCEHPDVISAVQLMRNFGQHNALMCGFRQARGKYIITMDDDLQHPPEEIPKLIAALEDGSFDLVYGVPHRKQHAIGRNAGSWLINQFFRFVFRTRITATAFRAIRRELLDAILGYDLNFTYIDGLLAWNTERIGEVKVEHDPRRNGRSGYSVVKLLTLALNLFTNFSLIPLQAASIVGLAASIAGLGTGAYYLLQAILSNISVPGYASIIVAVMVLGGLQLLALGIIGEYLGRVHLNLNRKPQYTVRELLPAARPDDLPAPQQHAPDVAEVSG